MAVLNLSTLRSELGQKIKKTNLANARLDRWLNMGVDDVVRSVDSDHLITETTITAVADQRTYYVPDCMPGGIAQIVDTSNDRILIKLTESDVEAIDPDRDDSGDARFYTTFGFTEYEGQPDQAATVNIVSASASDTAQTVRIYGLVNAVIDDESITLNGTTMATGTKSFTAIYGVRKSTTTVGRVRVTVNDSATTRIADIAPNFLIRQYQPFNLYHVPDTTDSYRVRFYRQPRPLINAEDVPDVSSDQYHEGVLIAASIRGHRDLFDFERAGQVLKEEWLPFLKQFKINQSKNRTNKAPVIGGTISDLFEYARLPGNYGYPVDIF